MAAIVFGIAVGLLMAAFVNWKYNSYKWIKTVYLLWLSGATLVIATWMTFLF